MVTTAQVNRLDAKIDALTAAIDTDSQPITVWIFDGETPDQAAARHRELRPDHAGRVIRFEYRYLPRHPVEEMFAVQTPEEIRPLSSASGPRTTGWAITSSACAASTSSRPDQPSHHARCRCNTTLP